MNELIDLTRTHAIVSVTASVPDQLQCAESYETDLEHGWWTVPWELLHQFWIRPSVDDINPTRFTHTLTHTHTRTHTHIGAHAHALPHALAHTHCPFLRQSFGSLGADRFTALAFYCRFKLMCFKYNKFLRLKNEKERLCVRVSVCESECVGGDRWMCVRAREFKIDTVKLRTSESQCE